MSKSSNSNTTATAGSGVSFSTLLFVVFLILKLTHTIDWSWWWVTSPLWITAGFVLGVLGIVLLFFLCVAVIVAIFGSRH